MNARLRDRAPRWQKVLRDLWDDKTRTILVVLSISVGVFAIGTIVTAYAILSVDVNRSFSTVNAPNIDIRTQYFGTDLVESVKKIDGVEDVQPRRVEKIRARRADQNWISYTMIALPNFNSGVNVLRAIEGTNSPGDGEVVVNQNLMYRTGYQPGDVLTVRINEDTEMDLTVVGMVTDQTAAMPMVGETNFFYVTTKTFRQFGMGDHYNSLYITVDGPGDDLAKISQVTAAVRERVEDSGRTVAKSSEKRSDQHPMISTVLAIMGLLMALGVLITVLSSSLIINTINAMLAQQLRQIGIMKLVGARSAQIMQMYLALILTFGAISLVLAVPAGAAAGYGLAFFISSLLGGVLQGFRLIPLAQVVQMAVAIIIPLGAGFFPINSGSRTRIQQAISNTRPEQDPSSHQKSRFHWPTMSWASRPLLLSLRNTFRKKGRLVLTIFTLTMAGAVFIAVFNVRGSLDNMMVKLMQHFMGDVNVYFNQPYETDKVRRDLMRVPGVVHVEGWTRVTGDMETPEGTYINHISLSAPPYGSWFITPEMIAGRWLQPGDRNALVISDTIFETYPDLKPGDTLTIRLPGNQPEQYTIVGIFQFVSMLKDLIAYGDFGHITGAMHLGDGSTSFTVTTELHDKEDVARIAKQIDDLVTDEGYNVYSIQSATVQRESATQSFGVLITFLMIMALLTAMVGSIGLMGTMSINVLERTRELGVMRTIGAVDSAIMRSVILEGMVIGVITWALAIIFSFPISSFLLDIIGNAIMGSPMKLIFTPIGIFIWLAVVLALSAVASIMPARNAARLTINEVLAYE